MARAAPATLLLTQIEDGAFGAEKTSRENKILNVCRAKDRPVDNLDFDQLLTPISLENPCGESLRYDPAWDELSQLRRTRKDPLDSSADTEADWPKVVSLSAKLLTTRTKDLQIAGWLTEALVVENGFAGFRDGLRLIRQLVEQYWDGVFPVIEDGDLSVRASPFTWLTAKNDGAKLSVALRAVPLAESTTDAVYNFNFWHSRNASTKGKEEELDAYERRVADADARRKEFDDAIEATSIDLLRSRNSELSECFQEMTDLSVLIDHRLGDEAPSWDDLRKTLTDIQVFVRDVLKRRGGLTADQVGGLLSDGEPGGVNGEMRLTGGTLRSRSEAIARLEEVARFFQSMDPHSPVAFLIRRAVRWANMNFEDLLVELVKDENTLRQVTETLGIGGTYSSPPASSE